MKILYLTQWYDPEPILKGRRFVQGLGGRGHDVEVLTAFPSYPLGHFYEGWSPALLRTEEEEGVPVHRVLCYPSRDQSILRRAATYLSFALAATLGALARRRHWDAVYAYHPPVTVALPAWIAARLAGARFVLDIQDLWPETLRATTMIGDGFMYRLVGRVSDFLYRRADRLVVLSEGFRDALVARGIPQERIHVIANWSRFDGGVAIRDPRPPSESEDFEVLYAGAIGPAQGLDVVLEAAGRIASVDAGIVFRLLGEGIDKARLQQRAEELGLTNVEFLPGVSVTEARGRMAEADSLLIHLRPDPLFEITVPSKIQDCLSLGRPIVAGVAGEARTLLERSGAGVLFPPGDAAGLAESVLALRNRPVAERSAMAAAARTFYQERLSLDRALDETELALTADASVPGGPR